VSDLGLFDRRILAVLIIENLGSSSGSYGMWVLSQHIEGAPNSFGASGLVMKEKKPQKGPGRSRFTYHMPSRLKRQAILSLEDSYISLVTLSFSRLKHLYRFEKIKGRRGPQNCLQIPKNE
jgi:hypothetical protein